MACNRICIGKIIFFPASELLYNFKSLTKGPHFYLLAITSLNNMPAYFVLALIWFFAWFILFILRKDQRLKMLIMSCAVILFAFFDYYSEPGYWHPQTFFSLRVGIEDILFGFSFGGVASALYPVKTNKHNGPRKRAVEIRNMAALSHVLVISLGLYFIFDVNIMISLPIGLLTGCLLIVIIKPGLAKKLLS
jgi:hypothetical protein